MKLMCVFLFLFATSFAKPNFYSERNAEKFLENGVDLEVEEKTEDKAVEEVTPVADETTTKDEVIVTEDKTEEETVSETTEEEKDTETVTETTEEEKDTETVAETTEEEKETEKVDETSEEPSTTEEVTQQITTVTEKDEVTDEKSVIETFLRRLNNEYSKVIDPFPIPDRDFKIEQSVMVATLKFQYKLHNCKVFGLRNLYKKASFEVNDRKNRDVRILTGKLAVDELKANCDVFIQFLAITHESHLNGFARDLVVDVEIEHNKNTGRLRLTQFQVEDLNDLYFSLEEGGWIRSVSNLIIRSVSRFFKGFLTTLFNIEIAYIARSIVAHIIIQE